MAPFPDKKLKHTEVKELFKSTMSAKRQTSALLVWMDSKETRPSFSSYPNGCFPSHPAGQGDTGRRAAKNSLTPHPVSACCCRIQNPSVHKMKNLKIPKTKQSLL